MRLLFGLLLLLVATTTVALEEQRASTLTPLLSCWFTTYSNNTDNRGAAHTVNQLRTLHLVLGYENRAAGNQIINVQRQAAPGDAPKNCISPPDYNGLQPYVFKTGEHPFVLDLPDTRNLLRTRTLNVTWSLGGAQLVLTHASLTTGNRCDTRYASHCPVKMPHFCEDGLYCNGFERCNPNFVHTAVGQDRFGSCIRSDAAPVTCGPGRYCSERLLGCADSPQPRPATRGPTAATSAPVGAETTTKTTVENTVVNGSCADASECGVGQQCLDSQCVDTVAPSGTPTEAPACLADADCVANSSFCAGNASCTAGQCVLPANYSACATDELCLPAQGACVAANTTSCANQTDCDALTSFCRGAATCTDGLCLYNASYVACPFNATGAAPSALHSGLLSVVCAEDQLACLSYYYCVTDVDCDDGLYCTGAETCAAGVCHEATPVVCANASRQCSEAFHCGTTLLAGDTPTDDVPTSVASTSDTTIMIFSVAFGAGTFLLLMVVILFIVWSQQVKRQAALNGATAGSTMASRLNSRKK